jgi:hypothetical protein
VTIEVDTNAPKKEKKPENNGAKEENGQKTQ